jgi:hypothetical protein
MREWQYTSVILDLGTRWRLVVNFTPPVTLPRGKEPSVPIS